MFSYSAYWGTWSRILYLGHPDAPTVEVNLTPIESSASSWEKGVVPVRIRVHYTAKNALKGDKVVEELPIEVKQTMIKNLGEEITMRLLKEDFLSQIDFQKYWAVCNGGANLEAIKKS